jgi:hypothetical protein
MVSVRLSFRPLSPVSRSFPEFFTFTFPFANTLTNTFAIAETHSGPRVVLTQMRFDGTRSRSHTQKMLNTLKIFL